MLEKQIEIRNTEVGNGLAASLDAGLSQIESYKMTLWIGPSQWKQIAAISTPDLEHATPFRRCGSQTEQVGHHREPVRVRLRHADIRVNDSIVCSRHANVTGASESVAFGCGPTRGRITTSSTYFAGGSVQNHGVHPMLICSC
jgi:hypothetical protein